MRLYLIQSRETGHFLVPHCGYVGWTPSLRHALDCGLVEHETAIELAIEHADDADLVYVKTDEKH